MILKHLPFVFDPFLNSLKSGQNALELFSTTPIVVLGLFEPFLKSWKNSENREKVKANPLPFWSILATFSTF